MKYKLMHCKSTILQLKIKYSGKKGRNEEMKKGRKERRKEGRKRKKRRKKGRNEGKRKKMAKC